MSKLFACVNVYQEEFLLADCLRSIRENLPRAEIILIDGAYESWVVQVKVQAAVEFDEGRPEIGNALLRLTSPASTDATIQIAKDFKVEHIVHPKTQCMCGGKRRPSGYYEKGAQLPWESEWKKRNEFFSFGRDGDYYFIIDADERVRGKWEGELTENHYAVVLQRDDGTAPYPVHRIYKHRPGIKMEGAHMAVWANELVQDERGSLVVQPVLMKKYDKEGRLIAPLFGGWAAGPNDIMVRPAGGGCYLEHMYNLRGSRDVIRSQAKGAYYTRGLSKEEKAFRDEHDI